MGGSAKAKKTEKIEKTASCCVLISYLVFVTAVKILPGAARDPNITITIATLLFAAASFFIGYFPLELISLTIPVVLALSGVLSAVEAFRSFSDPTIIIFGGMFVVGGAMFHTGLAGRIAWFVLEKTGGRRLNVCIAVMAITAAMSAFLSNTGTCALLLPIVCAICDTSGWPRKSLLFPMAVMCSAGGMVTMVGTPPNITVNSVLQQFGYEPIRFFDFAVFGIPMSLMALVFFGAVEWLTAKNGTDMACVQAMGQTVGSPLEKKQIIAGLVLIGVVAAMATGMVSLSVAAVGGAIICVFTGILTKQEAYEAIDFGVLFLFAGALSLSVALDTSGAGVMISNIVVEVFHERLSPIALITLIFVVTNLMTQFMSNTACCALMAPLGIEVALNLGISPYPIMATIALASSAAFATPVATPPNTMVAGPAKMSFKHFLLMGVPLNLMAYGITVLLIPRFWKF